MHSLVFMGEFLCRPMDSLCKPPIFCFFLFGRGKLLMGNSIDRGYKELLNRVVVDPCHFLPFFYWGYTWELQAIIQIKKQGKLLLPAMKWIAQAWQFFYAGMFT